MAIPVPTLDGWKLSIEVIVPTPDPEGPTEYTTLFSYVRQFGPRTEEEALTNVLADLLVLQTLVRDPDGSDTLVDVPISPSLSGDAVNGFVFTVADSGDNLGKSILKVGFWPPLATIYAAGHGGGNYGVASMITAVSTGESFSRVDSDVLSFTTVGNLFAITVRVYQKLVNGHWVDTPLNKLHTGDTIRVLDDGVQVSLCPELGNADPGVYIVYNVGPDGVRVRCQDDGGIQEHVVPPTAHAGDAPIYDPCATTAVDGDPPRLGVGLDPRDMPVSAPPLSFWFRADQLRAQSTGNDSVYALGNIAGEPLAELRGAGPGAAATKAEPQLLAASINFNGQDALDAVAPAGYLTTNLDPASGLGQLTGTMDLHLFMVVRETVHTLNSNWVQGRTDNVMSIKKTTATDLTMRNAANTNNVNTTAVPTLGEAFLLEARWSGLAGDFMRINGGAKSGSAAAGSGTADTMVFGNTLSGGTRASIEIAEIIRFDGELTDTDNALSDLYAYLADRYGITIDPPS